MLSVQVNLRTIIKNTLTIKKRLNPGTKFCAVVKANAYGFGLERISKLLEPYVDCYAVATIDEAIKLRHIGIQHDILVLGLCKNFRDAVRHNLIITIESLAQAKILVKQKYHPRIHLAVNTDMHRFGITTVHELRKTLQLLQQERIEGVYTHLAYESNCLPQVKSAIEQFKKLTRICQKHFPQIMIHAGCSGVIDYPPAHFNMIRIGKGLYGGIEGTTTALTVTSRIVAVKKIKPNTTISYGGTFTTNKAMVIGIVRGGYANGIPTQFGNNVNVRIGKTYCPIIGRVCMDYFFVDISNIKKPLSKSVVIIAPKPNQTLLAMAIQAKMITCDLILKLNSGI